MREMRETRETREKRERERHNSIMKTDRHTDGQSDLLGSLQEPKIKRNKINGCKKTSVKIITAFWDH